MAPPDAPDAAAVGVSRDQASAQGDADCLRALTTMVAAVNAHDINRSLACFSEEAVITLRPAFPSLRDGTHSGSDYLRKWLQGMFDRDFTMEIAVEEAAGNHIRTRTTTSMTTTRRLGIAPVVGVEDYVFEAGKITSLTWTTSDETRRKVLAVRRRLVGLTLIGLVLLIFGAWWVFQR